MSSWVRYSIAVYLGLLISGALARQPWQAPNPEPPTAPSVYHEVSPLDEALPHVPTKPVNADASA